MMKEPIRFTEEANAKFLVWVKENCHRRMLTEDGNLINSNAWLEDLEDKTIWTESDRRDYEMPGIESKSGNPELWSFDDDDLEWQVVDD